MHSCFDSSDRITGKNGLQVLNGSTSLQETQVTTLKATGECSWADRRSCHDNPSTLILIVPWDFALGLTTLQDLNVGHVDAANMVSKGLLTAWL